MDLDKEGEESSWLEVAAGETISSWWGSPSHHPAGGTPPKKELDTPWKYGYQYGYEDGGSIDSMVIIHLFGWAKSLKMHITGLNTSRRIHWGNQILMGNVGDGNG